jgi:hypothetical protein
MNKNFIIVHCSLHVLNEYDSNLIEICSIWNLFCVLEPEQHLYLIFGSVPIQNCEVEFLCEIFLKTNNERIILDTVH